jgi:hypothetical protein
MPIKYTHNYIYDVRKNSKKKKRKININIQFYANEGLSNFSFVCSKLSLGSMGSKVKLGENKYNKWHKSLFRYTLLNLLLYVGHQGF